MVAFDLGLEDDVAPPTDHGVGDANDAGTEDHRRVGDHVMHPQDAAEGCEERRRRAHRRPWAGIDQVVIVVRFDVCNIGHRLRSRRFRCLYQIGPDFSDSALCATGATGSFAG